MTSMNPLSFELVLAPIPYFWPRGRVLSFYEAIAEAPVDAVVLGETVCARRAELRLPDWIALGRDLAAAGKRVVLAGYALIESESHLKWVRRLVEQDEFAVEANEMGTVRLLAAAGRRDWIAGASLNVYNPHALAQLHEAGARRWLPPPELSRAALAHLLEGFTALEQGTIETELPVWGPLALAHSARCFTARHYRLQKDACEFRCLAHPAGLPLATRDGADFLVLNGVQVLSARPWSLMDRLEEVTPLAQALRLVPAPEGTLEQIAALDRARRLGEMPAPEPESCNGFWYGESGFAYRAPSSSPLAAR